MKIIFIAVISTLLMLPTAIVAEQDAYVGGRLTLSATGKIDVAPDMASLRAGVVSESKTAKDALAANTELMNRVFYSLKQAGIKKQDTQTSGLSLSPVYAPFASNKSKTGQRITDYKASNQITITIRDLTRIGIIIDALVQSGANNVGNITFDLKDQNAVLDQARKLAIANLAAKAELYAQAASFKVGDIISMNESAAARPNYGYASRKTMSYSGGQTPIAAGEISTSITVTATYKIVQ